MNISYSRKKIFCTGSFGQMKSFFFMLDQKPHSKRDGKWSNSNPLEIIVTNDRNGAKVMIFVANVNGKFPIVHLFIIDEDYPDSVNSPDLNPLDFHFWYAAQ